MPEPVVVIVAAVAAVVGVLLGFFGRRLMASNAIKQAEHYSQRLVAEARAKQKEIVLEGKDEALHLRRAAEEEAREQRATHQRDVAVGGGVNNAIEAGEEAAVRVRFLVEE